MRALTVQQPWAWAIIYGDKDVENRATGIVGTYRGPVLIHAGARRSERGESSALVELAAARTGLGLRAHRRSDQPTTVWTGDIAEAWPTGAFIGVVELVDEHPARSRCCSEWAEPGTHHLVFANPRPLAEPIPHRGRLGLWTPPADVVGLLTTP